MHITRYFTFVTKTYEMILTVDIVIGDPFQWKNQAWSSEIFTMKKDISLTF